MNREAAISEVLDRYMSSSLLRDRETEITANYGADIYAEARRIVQEAIGIPIDWSKETMDDALANMSALMRRNYPWLSSKAMSSLAFGFTMTWK